MGPTLTEEGAARAPSGSLYRTIWRWHFYAGLFVVPILCILAVTGAIYLFKAEIESALYGPMLRIAQTDGDFAPLEDQRAAIVAALPGAKLRGVQFSDRPDRAAEWAAAMPDGRRLAVFVDPYRGEVRGWVDQETRLTSVASQIHGGLMAGRVGEIVVELAACWAIVLVVTGLYLGWPRGRSLLHAFMPRLGLRGRAGWREAHVVSSFWMGGALVFLVLSGLPWAGVYGDILAKFGTISPLATSSPHFRGAIVPASGQPGATTPSEDHAEHHQDSTVSWAIKHAPLPRSGAGTEQIDLNKVAQIVADEGMSLRGLRIGIPSSTTGVFKVALLPAPVRDSRTLYLDQYSGKVLGDIRWSDYSPLAKAAEFGVSVHLGREFGPVNQWLGLLACILIVLTAISGTVMWWRRRPAGGGLGAPRRIEGARIPAAFWPAIIGLSILFPLVGASLLLILTVELLRRLLTGGTPGRTA
ncbi:MAG: hypothetical protein RLY86_1485 [Pseudomonadota bacterium]|jgi:uncharacterized iron-regulated membrane protein